MATPTPSRPSRVVIVAFGPPEVTRDAQRRAHKLVAPEGDVTVVAAHRGAAADEGTPLATEGLRAVLDASAEPTLLLHDDVHIGRDGVAAMMRAWLATKRLAVPWSNAPGTDHHITEAVPADDDARAQLARRSRLHGDTATLVRPLCILGTSAQLQGLTDRFLTVPDTRWSDRTVQMAVAGGALAYHADRCVAAEPEVVDRPLLIAAMIVRDEADTLPDCVTSLHGLVDRIEICDTGSIDNTVAVAQSFGASVIQRPWRDDFALARNEVLERCRDAIYILQIDADERVRCDDPDLVRRRLALLRDSVRLYAVAIDNLDDDGNISSTHDGARVIRTDDVTYRGALHERPSTTDGTPLVPLELKPLRLEHLGYRQRTVTERAKGSRNVAISERAYQEEPNWETAFQYARSLSLDGHDDDGGLAANLLRETLQAGDEVPITWRAWSLGKLGRDALAAGDTEAGLDLAQQALALVPADPMAGAVLTEAAQRLGRRDLIIEQRTTRRSIVSPKPFSRLAGATARVAGAEIAALLEFGATDEAFSDAAAALAADPAHFTAWPALVRSVAGADDRDTVDDLLVSAALNDRTGGCITAITRSLPPARAASLSARYLRGGGSDAQAVRNGLATALVAGDAALVDQFLSDVHRLEPVILERLADVAAERGLETQSNDLRTLAALPRRNFVVCGAGRSGTGYMSKALSVLGHPCGHEAVFGPLMHTAQFGALQGDSSWLALPYLDDLPSNAVIFHQVRDPLQVVRSLVGIRMLSSPSPYLDFIAEHAPEVIDQPDEISRCMAYWVVWNRRTAKHADGTRPYVRYRVEDLEPAVFSQFAGLLGSAQPIETVEHRLQAIPNNYNARRRDESVTIATLPDGELKDELVDLAEEFGYELAPALRGA